MNAANLRALHWRSLGLAQLRPSGLGGGERRLGPLADRLTLLLSDQSHDPDREPVRMRHVDRDELDPGLLQSEQEMRIAAQPVELGNNQFCVVDAAGVERARESRTVVVTLAALDLDVLLDQGPVAAVEPDGNRLALRL